MGHSEEGKVEAMARTEKECMKRPKEGNGTHCFIYLGPFPSILISISSASLVSIV
jgi:hypothetical protein